MNPTVAERTTMLRMELKAMDMESYQPSVISRQLSA
jgi:hypothetical protein